MRGMAYNYIITPTGGRMTRRMLQNGNSRCTLEIYWNENTHKRGEHNYRRDWEVHGNLSTVPGDQPWQEYYYRKSGGLAWRQRLPGPNHEEIMMKRQKGRPVFRWSCESARLPGSYLAKYGK